ncbi:oxidoreductase [Aureococcus anophagefferens]|nr:oxidoreductase [Aureococcus anophagefferens]
MLLGFGAIWARRRAKAEGKRRAADAGHRSLMADAPVPGALKVALLVILLGNGASRRRTSRFAAEISSLGCLLWGYCARGVPPARRESVFKTVEMLSKWSFIDVFIVVLLVVACHVFVEMRYAFYAFCLATVTSMLCGQVLLALHRRVHDGAAPRAGGAPAALAAHALKGRPPRAWQRCVAPAAAAVAALLCAGLTLEFLTFDVGGAAGLLQDLADRAPAATLTLGLFGLEGPAPGGGWRPCAAVAALTLVFAFFVPLANLAILAALWALPLRPAAQARLAAANDVTYGWSSLDVFVVAVVATGAQLGDLVDALAKKRCKQVDGVLGAFFDAALEGDATCLRLAVRVRPGCRVAAGAGDDFDVELVPDREAKVVGAPVAGDGDPPADDGDPTDDDRASPTRSPLVEGRSVRDS